MANIKIYLGIFLVNTFFFTVKSTEQNITVTCTDDAVYKDIPLDRFLGKWWGVEIYPHIIEESPSEYNSCPVLTIWETNSTIARRPIYGPSTEPGLYHAGLFQSSWRRDYRHLRLLWDEAGQDVEYALFFRNDSVGYWRAVGEQNGSIPLNPNYKRFTGSVQVLKAVQDHLLLNFCQESGNGKQAQLFSVLLSRRPKTLRKWEIDSVHSLLQTKKLSVASRRMVCGNTGSSVVSLGLNIIMLTSLLAYLAASLK